MNKKAEFAIKILEKYSKQQGFITRSTSDLSSLEQWLIIELMGSVPLNSYYKQEK